MFNHFLKNWITSLILIVATTTQTGNVIFAADAIDAEQLVEREDSRATNSKHKTKSAPKGSLERYGKMAAGITVATLGAGALTYALWPTKPSAEPKPSTGPEQSWQWKPAPQEAPSLNHVKLTQTAAPRILGQQSSFEIELMENPPLTAYLQQIDGSLSLVNAAYGKLVPGKNITTLCFVGYQGKAGIAYSQEMQEFASRYYLDSAPEPPYYPTEYGSFFLYPLPTANSNEQYKREYQSAYKHFLHNVLYGQELTSSHIFISLPFFDPTQYYDGATNYKRFALQNAIEGLSAALTTEQSPLSGNTLMKVLKEKGYTIHVMLQKESDKIGSLSATNLLPKLRLIQANFNAK